MEELREPQLTAIVHLLLLGGANLQGRARTPPNPLANPLVRKRVLSSMADRQEQAQGVLHQRLTHTLEEKGCIATKQLVDQWADEDVRPALQVLPLLMPTVMELLALGSCCVGCMSVSHSGTLRRRLRRGMPAAHGGRSCGRLGCV